jgi:hypothetical protein
MTQRALVSAFSFALSAVPLAGGCASDNPSSNGAARAGAVQISASGEASGLLGFAFPPSGKDDPFFVDGWAVTFSKFLVTFDNVTLSTGPDTDPGDQAKIGNVVATASGPWAVDLHTPGSMVGKSGDDKAIPIFLIENQNQNANKSFEADTKYAFGFDVIEARDNAKRVNIGANDADYAEMIAKGYSVFYVGIAEHKGDRCSPADDATLLALPKMVTFRLGFKTRPSFINCQNSDLGSVPGSSESPRGVFVKANQPNIVQMTLHSDHPFWSINEEDAPLRFDAFALAAAKNVREGKTATVTLEDLKGVPLAPISISSATLANRTCAPATASGSGALAYDAKGASYADLYEFISDRQSTQGHLNADGLCAVKLR